MSFHIPHGPWLMCLGVNEERGRLYKAPSSHFVICWSFSFVIYTSWVFLFSVFIYLVSLLSLSLSHTHTHTHTTQLLFSDAHNLSTILYKYWHQDHTIHKNLSLWILFPFSHLSKVFMLYRGWIDSLIWHIFFYAQRVILVKKEEFWLYMKYLDIIDFPRWHH